MTFYRQNLPHLQRDSKPHFITFVTKNRRILADWARDLVLRNCCHDHGTKYDLHASVVMPDHVHLILTPLIHHSRLEVISLIEVLKAIKGASAHSINQRLGIHGPVWQEESFDRVLRSSEKLDEKVAYILANPIRKGLVHDWHDYPWIWHHAAPDRY